MQGVHFLRTASKARVIEIAPWPVRESVICRPVIGAITRCKDSAVCLEVWASALVKTLSPSRWAFWGALGCASVRAVEGSGVKMGQGNAENVGAPNDRGKLYVLCGVWFFFFLCCCCRSGGGSLSLIVSGRFVVFTFDMNDSRISALLT